MKPNVFSPFKINLIRFAAWPALVFLVSGLSAQDRIILKNGNIIEAKVQEIQVNEVKYKRFDNQSGPMYTLQKADIFMITYENGSKDVINEQTAPAATQQARPRPTNARRPTYEQPLYFRRNLFMGGLCIPLKSDGTKMGFFAGYEHYVPFSGHFNLMTHASFSLNKYVYQDYYFYYKDQEFNSKIMAGPMLRTANGSNMDFYGALLLGLDFQAYAGFEDKLLSIAFGAGAGMTVNERLDINLRFVSHTSRFAIPFLQVGAGVKF